MTTDTNQGGFRRRTPSGTTQPVGALAVVGEDGSGLKIAGNLVPYDYDYIALTYTGPDLTTVVYKTGGSGGTTVATLTLTYSSSVLQTVTRT